MKKNIVVKVLKAMPGLSSVVFSSDNTKDALSYAEIMNRNNENDGVQFVVAEIISAESVK